MVKWYTRYFEGVVGASPCEFDSHLPHEKNPTDFRRVLLFDIVVAEDDVHVVRSTRLAAEDKSAASGRKALFRIFISAIN